VSAQKGDFLSIEDFALQVFQESKPWQTLWLKQDQRDQLSKILNRPFKQLRLRYVSNGQTSLWIFDEIGKELPITIGFAVDDSGIKALEILSYRETRGGEVIYPAFRQQFYGARLQADKDLNRPIDGITGATLSVWSVKRAAAAALLCHEWALSS
jgi:hypothetical protein